MPIHDWTRVPPGLFHHFHQHWSIEIASALNRDRLPDGLSALVEQRAGGAEADVLTIESRNLRFESDRGAVVAERPVTRFIRRSEKELYADRANRIVVRHHLGRIIAVIEIVSPGNKDSRAALRDFIEKAVDFLRRGVHLLVIDLFPPTTRDPFGIHKAIWDEIEEEDFELPPAKDRVLVSYESDGIRTAYIEPIGVRDTLPDMPLFLATGQHVNVPLETTYQLTWDASPADLRAAVETGLSPAEE
jgi:hypothetical protein